MDFLSTWFVGDFINDDHHDLCKSDGDGTNEDGLTNGGFKFHTLLTTWFRQT